MIFLTIFDVKALSTRSAPYFSLTIFSNASIDFFLVSLCEVPKLVTNIPLFIIKLFPSKDLFF